MYNSISISIQWDKKGYAALAQGKVGLLPHLATKNFFILRDRKVYSLEHYESNGDSMASNDRKNGKAYKKKPKVQKKTGKTIDGYSPAKLAIRAKKRGM